MVYIKCERCGIIFNYKNINKRFCDECTKIRTKELVRKSVKKKYHNDKAYREKKIIERILSLKNSKNREG